MFFLTKLLKFGKKTSLPTPSIITAHTYSYNRVTEAVFGEEGKKINDEVLEAYGREYGAEAASILKSYENTDFNAI